MNKCWIYKCISAVIAVVYHVEGTSIKQHFTFFNVERTWTEAKLICEDRGMNLLKIETIQETDYVIELITDELGITTLNSRIWTGLHRDSSYSTDQWTDGATPTWTFYEFDNQTGGDSCFSMNPPNGKWVEMSCADQLMFVCERDIGQCTFDERVSPTGCNGDSLVSPEVVVKREVSQTQCINDCLNSTNTNNVECWAAAHLPGCSCDDCWMFYSVSTDYCYQNEGAFTGVNLFIKICFEGDMQTITTDAITTGDIQTTDAITTGAIQTTDAITTGDTQTTDAITTGDVEITSTDVITTGNAITTGVMETISTDATITTNGFTTDNAITTGDMQTLTTDGIATGDLTTTTLQCVCPCGPIMSYEEIQKSIQEILKNIRVNKKTTSQFKRSLISATDKRFSSRVIGLFGGVILTVLVIAIFCIDIKNLYSAARMVCSSFNP